MTPLSLAEHCQAYGIQGRQNILKAKQENFTNNMPESGAAYEVNNFLCDPHNRSEYIEMPGESRIVLQDGLLYIRVFPTGTGGPGN